MTAVRARLDRLTPPVCVHLDGVDAVETAGLRPLVDAAARRAAQGRAPLLIAEPSAAVADLLGSLGLPRQGRLDPDAWRRALTHDTEPPSTTRS